MSPRPRILVIDDSSVSLLVCETLLVTEGFETRTATTVEQFHRTLDQWPPDAIVTDVEMPGISGEELCYILKGNPATAAIPVILYSSLPEEELTIRALRCGADGCVRKAERHEGLPRQLRAILDRR